MIWPTFTRTAAMKPCNAAADDPMPPCGVVGVLGLFAFPVVDRAADLEQAGRIGLVPGPDPDLAAVRVDR